MKEINLLPIHHRERDAWLRAVPALLLATLLAVGASGAAYMGAGWEIQHLNDKSAAIQALNTAAQKRSQPSSNTATTAQFVDTSNRISDLNQMAPGEVNWNLALQEVGDLIPGDTHLTTFTYLLSSGKLSLRLAGSSPSSYSFASFVQSIQQTPNVTAASVDSFSYNPASGIVTFTMTLDLTQAKLFYVPSKS